MADTINNIGNNTVLAPDFGIYLPNIDIEGGVAAGEISKSFLDIEDQQYVVWDLSGRWKNFLAKENKSLGGFNGYEIAAGVSGVNTDASNSSERLTVRFGPGFYFGKNSRLQVNAEIVEPEESEASGFWRIRSQFTVNM